MSEVAIVCPQCGRVALKLTGGVNRSRAIGAPVYCGLACAGLARRTGQTSADKKAAKACYDRDYRSRDVDQRKADRAAYHKRTYDPAKAKEQRKLTMPRHVEYCRRPEYRAAKKLYDRARLANQAFGPFAESALILYDLEDEIATRATRYEIYSANGTLNKALQRRRAYDQAIGS